MVKIAFLSDIHGNAVALESVLADLKQQHVDQIVVLGDLCFRGPEPKRALELVQELDAKVIKGNTDLWLVRGVQEGEVPDDLVELMNQEREWCQQELTVQDLDYLAGLPEALPFSLDESFKVHAFHATPHSLFDVVWPDASPQQVAETLLKEQAQVYVYGHIHLPYVRYLQGKCVINTGSVGLPFDGLPQASYALVETDGQRYRVSIQRVPYDVERVAQLYKSKGYPLAELMIKVVQEGKSPLEVM
ncbi:serine/threonine protein phosphatase [Caldalkalibacillus thermarum]|uniref:metallophosphoesterase family protein n=1 Tax=Caldalkalibacillus thermarum TaxID=296745 RepID=UPI001667AF13|nr:YfcE family phosphodiesterase [Caldalkalibacillus thermarum]GGK34292.1 serine/threonine protein phosphatase [Caldalkalibacillus thermarum]